MGYRTMDINRFTDCCAVSERGICTWLAVHHCQGEQCTFKRTRKADIDSLKHVYKRLASLDISMQIKIARKYYGGLMPWNEARIVEK